MIASVLLALLAFACGFFFGSALMLRMVKRSLSQMQLKPTESGSIALALKRAREAGKRR